MPIKWQIVSCRYGEEHSNKESFDWCPPQASVSSFSLMSLNPFNLSMALRSFSGFLKANKVEVVHVHHRRLALVLGPLCRLLGVPLVYTGHLVFGRSRVRTLRQVDCAIAINASVGEDIRLNDPCREIVEISNAVPFMKDSEITSNASSRLVICVGRLSPVKNQRLLLDAWAGLGPLLGQYKLMLVGEGELRTELEAHCKALGLQSSVEFTGFQTDVRKFIDDCLFMVLPSFVEGQPVAILEGAARGRATLCSDIPGSRDCIPISSTGLPNKFSPTDSKQLQEYLRAWLTNPQSVIEEGRTFHGHLEDIASAEVVVAKHLELYRRLAAVRRGK